MARKKLMDESFLDDESVYSEGARESLLDDAEISPEEEAFMRGYEDALIERKKADDSEEEDEELE